MKKITLLIISVLCTFKIFAFSFSAEHNGKIIYYDSYRYVELGTVLRVVSGEIKYSGDIVIPDSVEYNGQSYRVANVDREAFINCTNLTSITIPKTVGFEGLYNNLAYNSPFWNCTNLLAINVDEDHSGYSSVDGVLYNKDKTILYHYPAKKAIGSVTILESVEYVWFQAFNNCIQLTDLTFYDSFNGFEVGALYNCFNLTSITVPNSGVFANIDAFRGCSRLSSIKLSSRMKTLYENSFAYCSSLSSIIIPGTVSTIQKNTFLNCYNLNEITVGTQIPPVCNVDAFNGVNKSRCTLYVPIGAIDAYKNANVWKDFATIKESNLLLQEITLPEIPFSTYGNFEQFVLPQYSNVNLPITYISSNPEVATIDDNILSIHKVGVSTITALQAGNENYFSFATTLNVGANKIPLTVTVNDVTRVYGEVLPEATYEITGFINDDTIDDIDRLPTTFHSNRAVGSWPLSAKDGLDDNYSFNYVDGTITITKRDLIVKPYDMSREYRKSNPEFRVLYEGLAYSDSEYYVFESIFDWPKTSTEADASSYPGEYTITCTGGTSQNYNIIYETGTLTVTKGNASIFTEVYNKLYGEENPEIRFLYGGELRESDLTVLPTVSTEANEYSDVGEYPIVISGAESETFNITYSTFGKIIINKRPLTVKANAASRTFGDENPQFTYELIGLKNEDTNSILTSEPTFITTANISSNVGDYDIFCSGGEALNYNITNSKGKLTITKRDLIVTPLDVSREYGDKNPTFEFEYNGFVNGNTSAYIIKKPVFTSIATKNSDVGVYPITGSGGLANNYNLICENGELAVVKAPLSIMPQNVVRNQGAPNPTFQLAYAGFKNDDTEASLDELPTILCAANENSIPGTYDIILSGGQDKNYFYTLSNGTLQVVKSSGIDKIIASQIKVFPNPAYEDIFIQSDLVIDKVEIYDITGLLILEEKNFYKKISLSNLPSNLYLVKIYTDKGVVTNKFTKR